jgi:hypothetical protein
MKKIISLLGALLVSVIMFSQYQLNVQLTADEWGYISANYNGTDSIGSRFERKLRAAVQSNLPINAWTQNITIDTVPNAVVIWTYALWKSMPNGLRELYGNSVVTKIDLLGNAEIAAARTVINARYTADRDAIRVRAKAKNIDN